jgi:hypothetical protein
VRSSRSHREQGDATNVDQLRRRIDTGRGGDKVAHPDPAAAPLGTDDEAAGQPATRDQVAHASRQETRRPPAAPGEIGWVVWLYALFIVFLVAFFVWALAA